MFHLEQLARQSARAAHLWREDNDFLDELARRQMELTNFATRSGFIGFKWLSLCAIAGATRTARVARGGAKLESGGA